MSHRETPTVAPDHTIEPLVTFSDDDLIWIVRCPSDECGKVFAHALLSNAMRRYEEHRDLPAYVPAADRILDLSL